MKQGDKVTIHPDYTSDWARFPDGTPRIGTILHKYKWAGTNRGLAFVVDWATGEHRRDHYLQKNLILLTNRENYQIY